MPSLVQLVSTFQLASGLPEDRVQNVIHVVSDDEDLSSADVLALCDIFRDFYEDSHAGMSQTLGYWLSGSLLRAANSASIEGYVTLDFSGDTPFGSPVATRTFNLNAQASGSDYPEEVAAVISYYGDLTDVPVSQPNPTPPPATIRPQSRRRGRLYLGPLVAAAGTDQGSHTRPAPAFRTDATVSFKWMADQFNALVGCAFGVWSRLDEQLWPAVAAYMDDAWDTQRRRGVVPTVRTSVVIPP